MIVHLKSLLSTSPCLQNEKLRQRNEKTGRTTYDPNLRYLGSISAFRSKVDSTYRPRVRSVSGLLLPLSLSLPCRETKHPLFLDWRWRVRWAFLFVRSRTVGEIWFDLQSRRTIGNSAFASWARWRTPRVVGTMEPAPWLSLLLLRKRHPQSWGSSVACSTFRGRQDQCFLGRGTAHRLEEGLCESHARMADSYLLTY